MNQRTKNKKQKNLITMHKALYPRSDIDRLYVLRKEGGRGLICTEESIDTSIQRLEDYINKHKVKLNKVTGKSTENLK